MSDLTIVTNRQPRDILHWWDLSAKERAEFDYLDTKDRQNEAAFFRYRGATYDLGEFMATRGMPEFSPLVAWHGYHSDSYFSGVLVRYTDDFEHVVAGRYYS